MTKLSGKLNTVLVKGSPASVSPQVVIRRLPPSLTKEQLEEQLHPLPAHDYFGLFTADLR